MLDEEENIDKKKKTISFTTCLKSAKHKQMSVIGTKNWAESQSYSWYTQNL